MARDRDSSRGRVDGQYSIRITAILNIILIRIIRNTRNEILVLSVLFYLLYKYYINDYIVVGPQRLYIGRFQVVIRLHLLTMQPD